MKTLLIIGRFQPFHLGHLYVIKKYSDKDFFIKIGIGSVRKYHEKDNPFTKEERDEMIKLTLKANKIKDYKIYYIPDTKDDEEWMKDVKKIVGGFDILFTGNNKVKKLFKKENIKVHTLKESKERFKGIRAKEIRKKWLEIKSKKGLPEEVFNYLKKIRAYDRIKEIHNPKKKVHYLLRTNHLTISVAESCTGGAISRALISYSGSSNFFKLGIVAYDTESKIKSLKMSRQKIKKYGSISSQITKEMALRIRKKSKTDYSISSTGYADPSDTRAGTIYLSIASPKKVYSKKLDIKLKDRNKIIDSAVNKAIEFLYEVLKKERL